MKRFAVIVGWTLAASASMGVTPASAQSYPDYTGGRRPTTQGNVPNAIRPDLDTPDGFRIYSQMLVYGRCMAGLGKKAAAETLAENPNSTAEGRGFARMNERLASCRPVSIPLTATLVRGSIAEGMYLKSVSAEAAAAPWSAADSKAFFDGQATRTATLYAEDQPLSKITDCLAATRPSQVDAVLRKSHGNGQELAAMDALFTADSPCAKTRPARISRSYLRAFLANSAYRASVWRAKATK